MNYAREKDYNMDDLIYEYLTSVRDLELKDRDILTKYLYLFISKFANKNQQFLEHILKTLIKIMKDNRVHELNTNIIEFVLSYKLDDYDVAFLLNLIFYPNDYLKEYHDDYYFDLYKYCYYSVWNNVPSTHPFVQMCEVFHKHLSKCSHYDTESYYFIRPIMIIVICDYWLNHDTHTIDEIDVIFSKLITNYNYYYDFINSNGFTKISIDDKNLRIFINKLFFAKGANAHEPIRR